MASTASTAPTTKESPTVADLLIASESAWNTLDQLLQAQANSLAVDRADFEAETKHTHIVEFGPTVKLDVGGKIFRISLSDLIKERSLLSVMFSGSGIPLHKDENGTYFIDRSGTYFDVILNYLRTGKFFQPSDPAALEEVVMEAEFYEVDNMISHGPHQMIKMAYFTGLAVTHYLTQTRSPGKTRQETDSSFLVTHPHHSSPSDPTRFRSCVPQEYHTVKFTKAWLLCPSYYTVSYSKEACSQTSNWILSASSDGIKWETLSTNSVSLALVKMTTGTQPIHVSMCMAWNSMGHWRPNTLLTSYDHFLSHKGPPPGCCCTVSDCVDVLWSVCNGSTKQTEEVLKCGIVPQLIALLSSSPDVDVCQQATWALSNILGDCAVHRDSVLHLGFFPVLLKAMVRFPNKVFFLRKATEAISNGCRGVPPPDISYFRPSNDAGESVSPLPVLAALLQYLDAEVVTHVCWALSYMAESPPCIKLIISTGTIIPSLTRLLSISDTNIQRPALRVLGTVANGRFTLSFQFTLMINDSNVTLHPVLKKLRASLMLVFFRL
ncbi:Importin subunit alpha-1 [Pelomyxa schiedti]|nr:Importin subunit alpha-1 [Pelomyxa schiedti]